MERNRCSVLRPRESPRVEETTPASEPMFCRYLAIRRVPSAEHGRQGINRQGLERGMVHDGRHAVWWPDCHRRNGGPAFDMGHPLQQTHLLRDIGSRRLCLPPGSSFNAGTAVRGWRQHRRSDMTGKSKQEHRTLEGNKICQSMDTSLCTRRSSHRPLVGDIHRRPLPVQWLAEGSVS